MSTAFGGGYYVRWRGEESGPYDRATLRDLLESGQVTKHHQVSTDRETWRPLSQVLAPAPASGPVLRGPAAGAPAVAFATSPAAGPRVDQGAETMPASSPKVLRISTPERADAGAAEIPSTLPDRWYYLENDAVCGPVETGVLRSLVAGGAQRADSLVCKEGQQSWQPAHSFGGLLEDAWAAYGGGGAWATPAGFWRRLLAAILDGLILGCIWLLLGLVLWGVLLLSRLSREETGIVLSVFGSILAALASWIYFTCFESSAGGATIGKLAVGIAVTDEQGQPISYARANGRYWSKALSSIFCVGFLMAAFTSRKQALHDLIAGTLVVRRGSGETGV